MTTNNKQSAQPPLRVGILIDSFMQQQWVYNIIKDIQAAPVAHVTLVIKNRDKPPQKSNLLQKIRTNGDIWLYRLYKKLDSMKFRLHPNAFQLMDIQPLLGECPVIEVTPLEKKFSDYLPDDNVEQILDHNLDVALRFGFRILRGRVLDIARHGIWSYHHGDNLVNRGGPAGVWEVLEGNPITGSILQVLTEDMDGGQVLYRSYSATEPISVGRNRNRLFWKSSAFVLRLLNALYKRGPVCLEHSDPLAPTYAPYSHRLYTTPKNRDMIRPLFRIGRFYINHQIHRLLSFEQWFLAYRFKKKRDGPTPAFFRFKHLIPPKDRYWADPFPVKWNGKHYIFMEEVVYKHGKGHIAVIEIDEKGNHSTPLRALERDYHLSYPFVFEWNGDFYMIPETHHARTVELYRCVSFPDQWEYHKLLMEDVIAVDTTLAEIDDLWWMFTAISIEGGGLNDELHLFYADSPLGPWQPHQHNPVKSDVRSARPAGHLFTQNGDLYRPAQDASKRYGYAVTLNKILHLSPDEYTEIEVSKMLPHWTRNLIGTHTLNTVDRLTVIDGLARRRR